MIKRVLVVLFVFILIALVVIDLFFHNFRTVIPNKVYRSRELSGQQFAVKIKEYHIKSILNLRGAHPGLNWYDQEIAISRRDHIHHYNIALSSDKLPTVKQFRKLINIIETAPKPLLIHCESGVDRSGLASALALILASKSLRDADKQVSWKYFVIHHNSTGKQFMRDYCHWLSNNLKKSSRANLLNWLNYRKLQHN